MLRSGQAPSARWLLLAAWVTILLSLRAPRDGLHVYRVLQPGVAEAAQPSKGEILYLNLPATHTAPMYLSPTEGGLVSEWPGGTPLIGLGRSFNDGHAGWQLVRDPSGNEGWVAALFLDVQRPAMDPPADEDYLASVRWDRRLGRVSRDPRAGAARLPAIAGAAPSAPRPGDAARCRAEVSPGGPAPG